MRLTPPLPPLASSRIRDRRIEVGLSETGLARSLGVSPMTLRRVEGAGDPVNYDLRFIAAYAEALGIEFHEMFDFAATVEESAGVPADVEAVGAALAGSGGRVHIDALALALGWDLERTRLALDGLDVEVRGAGMRLVWFADTEVVLVAREGFRDVVAQHLLKAVEVTGLNLSEFTVVAQLANSGPVTHRSSSDSQVLKRLISTGLVRIGRTGPAGKRARQRTEVALSDITMFDLCLSDSDGVK